MTTARQQTVFAALRYADAWGAMTFLERCFGFERRAVFEGTGTTVDHAELALGTASFSLSTSNGVVAGNPWTTVKAGVYAVLPDAAAVNAHYQRAVAAGAEIARPLQDTHYGSREYSVWDLDRHLWSFGTYSHAVPGEPSLFVGLHYTDGHKAIEWLERAFGFETMIVVPGARGEVAHAELRLGDSVLMINSSTDEAACWGSHRQAITIWVPDPDAHHARAKAGGATIVKAPHDTAYDARAYCARDPEGFVWGFSTYRPAAR